MAGSENMLIMQEGCKECGPSEFLKCRHRFYYGSFKALETEEHIQWCGDNIDIEHNVVVRMNYY
jgi:hypothetical protein